MHQLAKKGGVKKALTQAAMESMLKNELVMQVNFELCGTPKESICGPLTRYSQKELDHPVVREDLWGVIAGGCFYLYDMPEVEKGTQKARELCRRKDTFDLGTCKLLTHPLGQRFFVLQDLTWGEGEFWTLAVTTHDKEYLQVPTAVLLVLLVHLYSVTLFTDDVYSIVLI